MKILITGAWQEAAEHFSVIEAMGHEVLFLQFEKDRLPCPYETVDAVICNGLFLYHDIENFTNLKYIQLTSAGFDRVPMEYVQAKGIEIHNARGVYSIPMAEFALCGVLQIYKQSRFFMNNQQAHKWEKHRGILELYGKTVCIVGCGSVGTECAKRFDALGSSVIGVDIAPYDNEYYSRMSSLNTLREAFAASDIVVLTLPLSETTRHLINAEVFASMRDGSVLVNIARGAIVDETALIDALASKLLGAVLDVFEDEPLAENSPLWDMENVIATPHNSFVGEGNQARLSELILNNMERMR